MSDSAMTYNEWVKFYLKTQRNPLMPVVTDKLQLKQYAAAKGVKTAKVLPERTDNCVIKANNDSGGRMIIRDGKVVAGSMERVKYFSNRPYGGVKKGEWWYAEIKHQVFIEEYLGKLIDYKFHCVNGEARFCQLVENKQQCIVLPNRRVLPYTLRPDHRVNLHLPIADNFEELLQTAEVMAQDFDFVRVDLYTANAEIYVGELTFAPNTNKLKRVWKGQKELGHLINPATPKIEVCRAKIT